MRWRRGDHVTTTWPLSEEGVTKGEKDLELRLAKLEKNLSQYIGKLDTDVEQKLAEMDKHVS